MITFDHILPVLQAIFSPHDQAISQLGTIAINRDLNGKVRLIVPESVRGNIQQIELVELIVGQLTQQLAPHSFPAQSTVLYEKNVESVYQNAPHFLLPGMHTVYVVDRLATEGRWDSIAPESDNASRIVFFSIKGGVGRSTAMAALAWSLAQSGKKVLVMDLDLESPGLSTALLPENKRPAYGIADWMVEDLVDNGVGIIDDMIATSDLSHDGEIYVVPAHGKTPGEYIAKLGRVWMPKINDEGVKENWSQRLNRLIEDLEEKIKPDVILIDSRSGIDQIASSCVTDLRANLVLLFTVDGEQTWSGYRVLFNYWHQMGEVTKIRERLQIVGAMVPDDERREDYFVRMQEQAWDLFAENLYDEIPPGDVNQLFNYGLDDESAPHYPWSIRWHRGFSALTSIHTRLNTVDPAEVSLVFRPLIEGINTIISEEESLDE